MLRGLPTMRVLIGLVLISPCVAAQVHDKSPDCASPEIVLQRYVDAIGGDAVHHIQSRTMTSRESNNFPRPHRALRIQVQMESAGQSFSRKHSLLIQQSAHLVSQWDFHF
jgi:hypothetical protein